MNAKNQSAIRYMFYTLWAVLMTALTYVLGAASLKVLRRKMGRSGFWILTTALSAGMFAANLKLLALAFFSLAVLMGVFTELEEMGLSFTLSSFFTLVINSLLGAGAFALWVSFTGPKWQQSVAGFLEEVLKPLVQLNPKIEISFFDLMLQLPSIVLILWMGAIYLAILLESRLLGAESSENGAVPMRAQLMDFRLPDPVIWVFILSLLGAFGGFAGRGVEAVAVNVLNVCLMLLFFQGIAVVGRFFESIRMSGFWQAVFMIIIIVHLFLFVSLLGLMDYWLNFRARLSKRAEEFNREV